MDQSTSAPSLVMSRRQTDFRLCYDDVDSLDSTTDVRRRPWGVAPIDFSYSIQTDVASVSLTRKEKDAILTSVSAAVIESVYEYGCDPQRSRKRRRQTAVSDLPSAPISRRAEILSVSKGSGHEWLGNCENLTSGSFCSEIRGTVEIAFDQVHSKSTGGAASDFESVGNIVLSRIEQDMINGNYVDKVNDDLRSFGRVISNMEFIDSDFPELVAQNTFKALDWSTTDGELIGGGMTRFSKAAIPIMVILSLLAMGLCWSAIKLFPADSFLAKRRRAKEEENLKELRKKESKHTLSLEATLEDLEEIEARNYGDGEQIRSRSLVNPVSPLSRFSNVLMRARSHSPSTTNDADGPFRPSDSETSSSARSYDEYPEPGRRINPMADQEEPLPSNMKRTSTPIRMISSLFGNNNAMKAPPAQEPTIMEKISACTGIPSNDCLGDGQKSKESNGTMMAYVVPSVERCNSLIDQAESPHRNISRSRTVSGMGRSFLPNMGSKKSAAYKEYINTKMLQRNAECDSSDQATQMTIGIKRTFTDTSGNVREMIAL